MLVMGYALPRVEVIRTDRVRDVLLLGHVREHLQDASTDHIIPYAVDDVVNFSGSKVVDPVCRETLSVPCLVPIGVFDTASMELGLLSKSLGKKAHSNEVILDENDD